MSYKYPAPVQTRIVAAFDSFNEVFDPVLLYQALLDLGTIAGNAIQFASNITTLVGEGETSLEQMSVEDLPEGTTILVQYETALLQYTLVYTAVDASIAPYIIKSTHSTEGDPRTWLRAGVQYHVLAAEELTESFEQEIVHDLGFPIVGLFVFTSAGELVPEVVWEPYFEAPNTTLWVTHPTGYEGTRIALLIY